jgi:hypothetical protein
MAGNATIGALKVNLGIDSAQFSAGLKSSQASLAKFGKSVAVGFSAVATAAAAAGAAMGLAVKGAIDSADALSKAAQKVGVTTEALSRLKYAADFSDVSLEQLTSGLGRLSKSMLDVAGGSQGPAATAFKALGIAVTDASGKLRSSDAVFSDIAGRFAQMEDGSTKTALAISLFGKAGAEMIPLLNAGKDGLAAMAAESDALGLTIGTRTGKAAEQFNDTLTKIGKIMGGVVNQVMEAALPALQSLANALASSEFAAAAEWLAVTLVGAFDAVVQAVVATTNAISGFMDWIKSLGGSGAPLLNSMLPGEKANLADRLKTSSQYKGAGVAQGSYTGFNFGSDGQIDVQKPSAPKSFVPVIEGAKAAKASVVDLMAGIDDAKPKVESFAETIGQSLADSFSSMADAVLSGVDPLKALGNELANIGKSLISSGIQGFFSNLFKTTLGGGLLGPTGSALGGFGSYGMFAGGGISDQPAIFGESGPEAAVPLPDGRSIPVTLSGNAGGGSTELVVRLDQGLIAQILKVAKEQSVQVVKSQAPAAVMQSQRNRG